MLKRCLTGAIMIVLMVGFFLLRTIDVRLFNILIYLFSILGTYEMYRATKKDTMMNKNGNSNKSVAYFSVVLILLAVILFVPFYTFLGILSIVILFASVVLILFIVKLFCKNITFKSYFLTLFVLLYPNLLLFTMLLANNLNTNSLFALLLIFIISPLSDTFAFFVGSSIGGKKLCPKISPKKTISGAIGGIIGGTLGALLLYFILNPELNLSYPVLFVVLIGLFGSIFTEVGDLFESYIKRKVGIKDMGKILPGHGGILDRIDGILFASLFISIVFLLL